MSDILRFRLARSPQRKIPTRIVTLTKPKPQHGAVGPGTHWPVTVPTTAFVDSLVAQNLSDVTRPVGVFIGSPAFAGNGRALSTPLRALDA